jgi:hypothetical protein
MKMINIYPMGQKRLNTLALLSIEHDFCSVPKNWEISDFSEFKTIGSSDWANTFEGSSNSEFQVGNSGLFLELRPEGH